MDVSVVIATRNKTGELRRCLEAVMSQRCAREFEVLVCDDGSDDGTEQMIQEWGETAPRLRYLKKTRPGSGPAAARNLGIRHARAPLVAMTDDDTIPDDNWLERLCAAARPGVAGVEGRVTAGRRLGPWETAPSNEHGGVYLTCNALYRRDVLAEVGGFDERFPFAAFEDCDLAARVRRHGAIAWEPDAVVVHPPRPMGWRAALRRLRHLPWIMVTGRRYGYLAWPRYPTKHPRARVIWNALVALPAGRLMAAARSLRSDPWQAIRAGVWALLEPVAVLCTSLPELIRFDLDSAAFQMDYLNLARPRAKVGVVIVDYKQPENLVRCVRSFLGADYPDLKIIVVESAAEPASLRGLQEQLPGVDWIAAAENVGYTGGNNLGISRALEQGCDYVLLVNPDTECIAPDFIARLARFLDLNPRVAVAGPRVYLRRFGEVQNTVLRYPSLLRNFVNWFGYRLFPGAYERSGNSVRRVEMLNGVCVLLRADALREVGAFDPRYFMYLEDADLGLRLQRAGWQLAYVPVDSIIHHQTEAGYEIDGDVSLLLRRNTVYFLRKHRRLAQAWGMAAANLLLAALRTCASTSVAMFQRRLHFVQALWHEFAGVLGEHSLDAPAVPRPRREFGRS